MTNGRDPLQPSEDIGTRDEPGGPGSTEVLPEPGEGDIYVPDGGKPDSGSTSPSDH